MTPEDERQLVRDVRQIRWTLSEIGVLVVIFMVVWGCHAFRARAGEPATAPEVQVLIDALSGQDAAQRRRAAEALFRMANSPKRALVVPAAPALAAALNDKNLQAWAAKVFKLLPSLPDGVTASLVAALATPEQNETVKRELIWGLAHAGAYADARATVAAILAGKDSARLRVQAATFLGQCGPDALPALEAAREDADAGVRSAVIAAIAEVAKAQAAAPTREEKIADLKQEIAALKKRLDALQAELDKLENGGEDF